MAAFTFECRIVHRRLAVVGGEAFDQFGIGAELFGSAVELADVAEKDFCAAVYRADDAADANVLIEPELQIADLFAVGSQADDGKAAVCVGGPRTADVENAGSIRQFDDVVNVGVNTDIFVLLCNSFFRRKTCAASVNAGR